MLYVSSRSISKLNFKSEEEIQEKILKFNNKHTKYIRELNYSVPYKDMIEEVESDPSLSLIPAFSTRTSHKMIHATTTKGKGESY